jgi:hypothetical protein
MSEKKTKDEEAVEVLEPDVSPKTVTIGEGELELVFTQKPLSFFGKIEFFSVAGKAVEKVLEDGNTISDLLGSTNPDNPLGEESQSIDSFVRAIAGIVQHVPEVLSELYCIILSVPRNNRDYVKARLENELTDEQGFEILETFVDQNWEVLTGFFNQGILPLYQKLAGKMSSSAQ